MYYILGYLQATKKAYKLEDIFLLALDGDVDFQPNAVLLVLDRMKRNPDVGAACGRIHPTGKTTTNCNSAGLSETKKFFHFYQKFSKTLFLHYLIIFFVSTLFSFYEIILSPSNKMFLFLGKILCHPSLERVLLSYNVCFLLNTLINF